MADYSIVVPVHNEAESLPILWNELKREMEKLTQSYEVIFVDDGSSDRSLEFLADLQNSFPQEVQVIRLAQRRGQTFALKEGLSRIRGKIAMTLDADLQNDPADIPRLLEKMEEGYDVVCGWRRVRMDEPLKRTFSQLANILQRQMTGVPVHDLSCTLRIYKRECLNDVSLTWDGQHRFIPLILFRRGYKIAEVVSNHRKRFYGTSKYRHRRIPQVVLHFFKILSELDKGV